jgi:hypothetical protein
MELAKFQRLTNLRFLRPAVSTAHRQFSGISFFSLPALSFLTFLPFSDSLGPNLGRLCAKSLWARADFCQDEVSFGENNIDD